MTVEKEVKSDQEATMTTLQVSDEEAVGAAAALQTTTGKEEASTAVAIDTGSSSTKEEEEEEESNFLSHLKEHEKKALKHLKSKLEQAILQNDLFISSNNKNKVKAEQPKENAAKSSSDNNNTDNVEEALPAVPEDQQPAETNNGSEQKEEEAVVEETIQIPEVGDNVAASVDTDISLWGVPLLPSKGAESTDVLLLKFLRARDFKVNDALSMLKKTLQWRKDFNTDSILDEHLDGDDDLSLSQIAHMSDGVDRQGHPICYNNFGALENKELYDKAFGTEEKRAVFLRWRFQLMEKGIQKLDFNPAAGGVNSIVQINDLNNSPGPFNKELRLATKQAVTLLQDNYPEFVARNIFINVPLWYYALNSLLSPFLTQRTKSKFVVARPGKVTETLLKYIPVEEIPIKYGGFKRDNEFEFSATNDNLVSELTIKPAATATIEIPTPETGATFIWDLAVLGWEVKYKEEFVPTDEGSYTIIIHKSRKISPSNEEPVRNTFRTTEPGKIVLTIENSSNNNKKVLYRYKTKKSSCF